MSRAASPRSFLFIAAKPGGGRSMGMRQARSERALADTLRRDKLVLMRTWALPSWVSVESPVGLKDQAAMNEQLAQLVGRGVPLVEAMEVTETVVTKGQQARLARIRELVAGGSSFADACQQAGGFDRVTVAIYRAAERTGDLAGAAQQLAENARRRMAIANKAVTLMIYPSLVLTIGLLAGLLLLTLIVPRIGESLLKAGLNVPGYTIFLMNVGNFIKSNALIIGGVAVGLGVVAYLARKDILRALGKVARLVPLLGEVILTQEMARFFSVMAAMTRSGVPLADALGVSVGAVGHPKLRKELDQLRTRLVQGGVLGRLIDGVESLPMATRKLLVAADRSGDMENAFSTLSEDMTDRLDRQTSRLLAALEPLILVVLFLIIGAMIMAIVIPMLTIASQQLS